MGNFLTEAANIALAILVVIVIGIVFRALGRALADWLNYHDWE